MATRLASQAGYLADARAPAPTGLSAHDKRTADPLVTHDPVMLNPLSGTHATFAAVAQAIAVLRQAPQGA